MDTWTRSSLDSKTSMHPTQGSIPFSATQSLRLCLPFQCNSGCAKKKTNPLDLSVRFLLTLGLSSYSDPISIPKPVQRPNKRCIHSNYSSEIEGKHHRDQNQKWQLSKTSHPVQFISQKWSMASCGLKWLCQSLKLWVCPPIWMCNTETWKSQPWGCENDPKCEG